MAMVACHTQDCGNANIDIELSHPDDEVTGQPVNPWNIYCGVCGNQITDIRE